VTPSFLWLAAAGGALSLLTPCVFPMIPITAMYFNREGRRSSLTHAVLFAMGIVLTFTAVGLALAVVVGAAGLSRFAADPWVNIIIGILFVGFALSLLGAYDLPLPFTNRFLNRLDASARDRSGNAFGSVLMGVVLTLASFTCTAPFVGPLLVSASRGEWLTPLAGMAVFSSVFAIPFFLLALVPQWTSSLPRAGAWLKDVKVVVGLFEIAAAIKFFSNADMVWGTNYLTRNVIVWMWTAIAVTALLYLLARRRWIAALVPVAATVFLAAGLRGRSLGEAEAFLPPQLIENGAATKLDWILNDHSLALQKASTTNRLVFVDFTGYTCTNCRWMEANMFSRADVSASLSRYVLSRLYTDGEGELYEKQQLFQEQRFGTVALPLYAIVDGSGKTVRTFSGLTRNPAEFLAFLRDAS
jgi:thiol:disulfide interchange protein DsbD